MIINMISNMADFMSGCQLALNMYGGIHMLTRAVLLSSGFFHVQAELGLLLDSEGDKLTLSVSSYQ